MYWLVSRDERLSIEPRFFASGLDKELLRIIRQRFENTYSPQYGLTLSVVRLDRVGEGMLDPDSGSAVYDVSFSSLVFCPFLNEVIHAVVSNVSSVGIHARVASETIFIPSQNLPQDLIYVESEGKPCFRSASVDGMADADDPEVEIAEDTRIRVRVCAVLHGADKVSMVGTLNSDYLG